MPSIGIVSQPHNAWHHCCTHQKKLVKHKREHMDHHFLENVLFKYRAFSESTGEQAAILATQLAKKSIQLNKDKASVNERIMGFKEPILHREVAYTIRENDNVAKQLISLREGWKKVVTTFRPRMKGVSGGVTFGKADGGSMSTSIRVKFGTPLTEAQYQTFMEFLQPQLTMGSNFNSDPLGDAIYNYRRMIYISPNYKQEYKNIIDEYEGIENEIKEQNKKTEEILKRAMVESEDDDALHHNEWAKESIEYTSSDAKRLVKWKDVKGKRVFAIFSGPDESSETLQGYTSGLQYEIDGVHTFIAVQVMMPGGASRSIEINCSD